MFWDSSAIVPLLLPERSSEMLRSLAATDRSFAIWWGTPLECQSGTYRRHRHRAIDETILGRALARLGMILEDADVIAPTNPLRDRASRLLAVHALRAADALQLSASLAWCEDQPRGALFVCLDERLRKAATEEGFTVLPQETT